MLTRLPPLIAAVALSIYWFWVIVKLIKLARKIGKDPNAMPRERVGQLMRILWYPIIILLLIGLWLAVFYTHTPKNQPWLLADRLFDPFALGPIPPILAAALLLLATVITFICWRKMGRSWRIGIDPNEKLDLVSTGPYRYVRHPIYSLRILINLCAILISPTLLVLISALIDALLLQIEARREERYMESKHGEVYARYKNSVGRFIPRRFVV